MKNVKVINLLPMHAIEGAILKHKFAQIIDNLITGFFAVFPKGPNGFSKDDIEKLSIYQKLLYLRMIGNEVIFLQGLPNDFLECLNMLLNAKTFNPREFMVFQDHYSVVLECGCGRHFVVGNRVSVIPLHRINNYTFCFGSGSRGVNIN